MTKKRKSGRPTILEKYNITLQDLTNLYHEYGSYSRVAAYLGVTKRTILTYLSKHGKRKRGRPQGYYTSPIRNALHHTPSYLTGTGAAFAAAMAAKGHSKSYALKVHNQYQRLYERLVIRKIKQVLKSNVAIRDTKGRYIPMSAIRYVWIPRLKWDYPVFIRVVLKDRTKAKLPTTIKVSAAQFIEQLASTDQ